MVHEQVFLLSYNALLMDGTGLTTSDGPIRTERATTVQDYAAAVRNCAAAGEKVVDYGVAHGGLGHPPPAEQVRITAPSGGYEHWKTDMSARVPGGMTIGELQRRLAEANQWLPIDADEDMTVAEVIAHDVSGPLRLAHGTCRDLLLGLRYVDATGTLITVGGRTVKNVAGYDVTRMLVGSLNTLGLIADANLRTSAIPPQVTGSELHGLHPAALDPLMTDLLTSDAAPYYMEWRWRGGEHVLHIAYSGTATGCDAQHAALLGWLRAHGVEAKDNPIRTDGDLAGDSVARCSARAWRRSIAAHVKLVVPPAQTGSTINSLAHLKAATQYIDGLPAHGVIHIGADWSPDQACTAERQIDAILSTVGGLRAWHCRPGNAERIAPFAPPQPDWAMLTRLKQVMDPANMFNPGRFPYDS